MNVSTNNIIFQVVGKNIVNQGRALPFNNSGRVNDGRKDAITIQNIIKIEVKRPFVGFQ